jgi:hypothetical protein
LNSFEFPAFGRKFEAFSRQEPEATPEANAWIWSYAVIMREEGEIICGSVEEVLASVFSGLG